MSVYKFPFFFRVSSACLCVLLAVRLCVCVTVLRLLLFLLRFFVAFIILFVFFCGCSCVSLYGRVHCQARLLDSKVRW